MIVFIKYADCIKWDDKVKQFIFKDGLKIEVFIELMRYNIVIKNLDDLIRIIIEIDNKFY